MGISLQKVQILAWGPRRIRESAGDKPARWHSPEIQTAPFRDVGLLEGLWRWWYWGCNYFSQWLGPLSQEIDYIWYQLDCGDQDGNQTHYCTNYRQGPSEVARSYNRYLLVNPSYHASRI